MSENKIALITGGNRGLGRATALDLAAEGIDVVLTYRSNRAEADGVVAEVGKLGATAAALRLDLEDVASFAAFAEELRGELSRTFGRESIDFLVNNAGYAAMTTLGDTSVEDVDQLFSVVFRGPYFITQTVAPLLADGGSVVNLSSMLARYPGTGWSIYGSLKTAVEQLTRYLAVELAPRGIRVNVVAPGPTGTDFAGGVMRDDEEVRKALAEQASLGRVGEPEDIGPVVTMLLSERSRWITGQRLEASGGAAII